MNKGELYIRQGKDLWIRTRKAIGRFRGADKLYLRFSLHKSFQLKRFRVRRALKWWRYVSMRRVYCFSLVTFLFVLGCAQNQGPSYGFPGKHQESFQPASRDYDQREQVADDTIDFRNGNYDPDPDLPYF